MNTAVMVDKIITKLEIVAELKRLFSIKYVFKMFRNSDSEFDLTLQS